MHVRMCGGHRVPGCEVDVARHLHAQHIDSHRWPVLLLHLLSLYLFSTTSVPLTRKCEREGRRERRREGTLLTSSEPKMRHASLSGGIRGPGAASAVPPAPAHCFTAVGLNTQPFRRYASCTSAHVLQHLRAHASHITLLPLYAASVSESVCSVSSVGEASRG